MRLFKLTLTNILLLFTLYSFGVLTYHCMKYNEITTYGFIILFIILALTVLSVALCCLSYKKHRIGRFNIDIFTTIFLFCVFMLGFLVPGHVNLQYTHILGFYPGISKIIYRLGENAIGVHEILLFISTIIYGLTIGEHQQKYDQ